MKDYTKYDFAAIKGAYVEMEVAPTENPAIHATINGMVVYQDPTSILVLRNSGTVTCFLRSEIVPGSLTAKIKVEDMSVKQLKKAFNLGTYEALVFNEATGTIANRDVDGGELGHTYEELPFNDYIDCTEWGWKHE